MAMNKKEKELMEMLETKAALHLSTGEPTKRDLAIPDYKDGFVNGYSFNEYSMVTRKSCSTANNHSIGDWDKTTSQKGIEQFSTELLAAKALRFTVEYECAKKLRSVDLLIEKLQQAENKEGEI